MNPVPQQEKGGELFVRVDFRPVPKAGRDRRIDKNLLTFLKRTIARCEWPLGCKVTKLSELAAHHIYGRGMGGGKRNDDPQEVAILCHKHHNLGPGEHAHHAGWWHRGGQERIKRHIRKSRTATEWAAIAAYMAGRGV